MDNTATKDEVAPSKNGGGDEPAEAKEQEAQTVDTVGAATTTTNGDAPPSPKKSEDTNMKDVIESTESEERREKEKDVPAAAEPTEIEAVKDHGDNGEEVVEGEEDTVIY